MLMLTDFIMYHDISYAPSSIRLGFKLMTFRSLVKESINIVIIMPYLDSIQYSPGYIDLIAKFSD